MTHRSWIKSGVIIYVVMCMTIIAIDVVCWIVIWLIVSLLHVE